jgi:hypothetical protein
MSAKMSPGLLFEFFAATATAEVVGPPFEAGTLGCRHRN